MSVRSDDFHSYFFGNKHFWTIDLVIPQCNFIHAFDKNDGRYPNIGYQVHKQVWRMNWKEQWVLPNKSTWLPSLGWRNSIISNVNVWFCSTNIIKSLCFQNECRKWLVWCWVFSELKLFLNHWTGNPTIFLQSCLRQRER